MTSVKVFVPYGAVGLNCTEEAFEAGLHEAGYHFQ